MKDPVMVITDGKGKTHTVQKGDEIFLDNNTLEVTVVKKENQYHPTKSAVISSLAEPSMEETGSFKSSIGNMQTKNKTYFMQAIDKIVEMHQKKAKDYTAAHREFGNFEDAAKHAGIRTDQQIESLIGTKEARRQNLEHNNLNPVNESVEDTLYDRAVYAVIRYAHYLSEKESGKPVKLRDHLNSLSDDQLVEKIAEHTPAPGVYVECCKKCGHVSHHHNQRQVGEFASNCKCCVSGTFYREYTKP